MFKIISIVWNLIVMVLIAQLIIKPDWEDNTRLIPKIIVLIFVVITILTLCGYIK